MILVVEDDISIRDALTDIMRMECLTARFAADGQEALNMVREGKPHLVILDMTLPIVGGIAVAHEIRNLYNDVPILVITADGMAQRKAAEATADAYLQKPFELKELLDAVYRLLDSHDG